jgi:hypothetical protein
MSLSRSTLRKSLMTLHRFRHLVIMIKSASVSDARLVSERRMHVRAHVRAHVRQQYILHFTESME